MTNRFAWRKPYFDTPFERRRLRVLNGLFLGFAKIGGSSWVRGDTARELAIHVGNASCRFELDNAHQTRRRGDTAAPGGKEKLYLSISANVPGLTIRWEDDETGTLESKVTQVIVGMLVAAEHSHRRLLEQQAAWKRREREEAERTAIRRKEEEERRERERLAAIEQARIDNLLESAEAWQTAIHLRRYVNAVNEAAAGSVDSLRLQAWSRWALAEADKLDPIVSGRSRAEWPPCT